ncbi:sigma factor-like helix-turn-helix DNA-binding protein [Streptomyces sp. NPDC006733]|uniref:RNA polymerase sigma factor n=1 Tax=Streptomyces sp. NPDC006733 TaxID=3155460 RepID=UPI0033F2B7DF
MEYKSRSDSELGESIRHGFVASGFGSEGRQVAASSEHGESIQEVADAAMVEIRRRHAPAVLNFARTMCDEMAPAGELATEAFVRTFNAVRNGEGPHAAWRLYLLTEVQRVAVQWVEDGRGSKLSEQFCSWAEKVTTATPGVADPVTEYGGESLVVQAIRSLSERRQALLWHCEVERDDVAEVATLLGISTKHVATMLHQSRADLLDAYLQAYVLHTEDEECREHGALLTAWVRRTGRRRTGVLASHADQCEPCSWVITESRAIEGFPGPSLAAALLIWKPKSTAAYGQHELGKPRSVRGSLLHFYWRRSGWPLRRGYGALPVGARPLRRVETVAIAIVAVATSVIAVGSVIGLTFLHGRTEAAQLDDPSPVQVTTPAALPSTPVITPTPQGPELHTDRPTPKPSATRSTPPHPTAPASPTMVLPTGNLIVNGNAEDGDCTSTARPVPPGWARSGGAAQICYGTGNFPGREQGRPPELQGAAFFWGGHSGPAELEQSIDLAPIEGTTTALRYLLTGRLGGYRAETDSVTVTAAFIDVSGQTVSSTVLRAVTATERGSITGFRFREQAGALPPATRRIIIKVAFSAGGGTGLYRDPKRADGFADDLSLQLVQG